MFMKLEEKMTPRKKFLFVFSIVVCTLGFVIFLSWLCFFRFYKYTDDAYVHGNIVQITPIHEGFVTEITRDDTFLVKKGQLLVKLNETDAKIRLQKAKEELAQTVRNVCELFHQVNAYRAEIDEKKFKLIVNAQDYLHRLKVFREEAVSIEDFEHAIADLRSQFASYEMSGALYYKTLAAIQNTSIREHPLVVAASDKVRDAWVKLYRCNIYSPVDGLVAERKIQVGMQVPAGATLMSVIPLDQIWVNANFKETQLKDMRIGQKVNVTADLWGINHVFHGKIVGLPGGAGNAFSLLPPQNLSGNWIKIVQRLPVRVRLDPEELKHRPLRLGLTCRAFVDIRDRDGEEIPKEVGGSPHYQTDIFEEEEVGDQKYIESIVAENLDPTLSEYLHMPINLPMVTIDLPPILEEAFSEDAHLKEEVANFKQEEVTDDKECDEG